MTCMIEGAQDRFQWEFTRTSPPFAYRLVRHATDQPVVLFLHGGPGDNCAYFSACCGRLLEARYTVLWVDQPGCGHSPRDIPCEDHDPDAFLVGLCHMHEQLALPPMIVMGHSWGGMLAGLFASQMPRRTRALINVCGPASFPEMLYNLLCHLRGFFSDNAKALHNLTRITQLPLGFARFTQLFHYARIAGLYYRDHDATRTAMEANIRSTLSTGEYDANSLQDADDTLFAACEYHSVMTRDITPQLLRVECPTLVIGGTHDRIVDRACLETYWKAIHHAQRIIFSHSGHNPFQEEPENFLTAIDHFITQLP